MPICHWLAHFRCSCCSWWWWWWWWRWQTLTLADTKWMAETFKLHTLIQRFFSCHWWQSRAIYVIASCIIFASFLFSLSRLCNRLKSLEWNSIYFLCIIFLLLFIFISRFSSRLSLSWCSESVQTYSFVLTSTDSKWRFGFCRHDAKTRTAMVLISYLPWHDIFIKFLNVLGELKRTSPDEFQPFLAEAYNKGVPEPGACLKLFYSSRSNVSCGEHFERIELWNWFNSSIAAFHISASAAISIAKHSGKQQFESLL